MSERIITVISGGETPIDVLKQLPKFGSKISAYSIEQLDNGDWQVEIRFTPPKPETVDCPSCSTEMEYIREGDNFHCERCGVLWRFKKRVDKPS